MARITDRSRVDFIRALGGLIASGTASALLPQLDLIGTALAGGVKGSGDYKALVCVYLAGGNDSFNLLAPRDSTAPGSRYDTYRLSRGDVYDAPTNPDGLALAFADTPGAFNGLIPLTGSNPAPNDSAFGVHPRCADYVAPAGRGGAGTNHRGVQFLHDQGDLAFVANLGTLVEPITRTEYDANSVPRPPQLFSHNDQESLWHLGRSDPNFQLGWGGQVAARLNASSGSQLPTLSPCISISGSNRFQVGRTAVGATISPYQMSIAGAQQLCNYGAGGAATQPCGAGVLPANRRSSLDSLLAATRPHPLSDEYRSIYARAIDLATTLTGKLDAAAGYGRITTLYQHGPSDVHNPASNQYPAAELTLDGTHFANALLDQLRMVARMIKLSSDPAAGVTADRQIYYVRLGGFDTHGAQMPVAGQPLLMARISQALGWFRQAMIDVGLWNDVVVFTASEFGRTLSSNGNGSDHAWGGVQMVAGGAVNGQRIYGRYPSLALDADNDSARDWSFSRGQFIPSTSQDQFAATMARWMGVSDTDLAAIFPNLVNFGGAGGLLNFLP